MDHARFCRWVVFRGVPGINNVIIGAVRALCKNAPMRIQGGADTVSASSRGSGDLDVQSGSAIEEQYSTDVSNTRRLTVCDSDSEGHSVDSSGTRVLTVGASVRM